MTKRASRTIKLEGFEELIRALGDPKLAQEPMGDLLASASKLGEKASIDAISGGTGVAVRSIQHKVWPRTLSARVYTMIKKPRSMSIDKGREPGEDVTIEAIARWLKRTVSRQNLNLSRDERSKVIAAWGAIREHGAKGKGYIAAAKEAIEKELPQLQERAMRQLGEMIKREL